MERFGAAQGPAEDERPLEPVDDGDAERAGQLRRDPTPLDEAGGGLDPAVEDLGRHEPERFVGAGDLEGHGLDPAGVGVAAGGQHLGGGIEGDADTRDEIGGGLEDAFDEELVAVPREAQRLGGQLVLPAGEEVVQRPDRHAALPRHLLEPDAGVPVAPIELRRRGDDAVPGTHVPRP